MNGWRTIIRVAAASALAAVLLAACGGEDPPDPNALVTTTTAKAQVAAGAGECPFSGAVDSTYLPGPGTPEARLTAILPNASGCIDQIRLNLDPALVPATIGYDVKTTATPPAAAPGTYQLVVRLGGPATAAAAGVPSMPASKVTWSGSSTVEPKSLTHIKQIDVAQGADGELDLFLTLGERSQFLTSTSAKPAYLVVSVGTSL
ncbi:MAG TPA: hypothetical protein VFJ85_09105 [Acidimicrobiales bacterium]|nr:hypothetical protein [Acidimicrobiales bacterium]